MPSPPSPSASLSLLKCLQSFLLFPINCTTSLVRPVEARSFDAVNLSATFPSTLWSPSDLLTLLLSRFADYCVIFNGNVVCASQAVVCPKDAEDVSKYVSGRLYISTQVSFTVRGSFYFASNILFRRPSKPGATGPRDGALAETLSLT